MRVLETRCHDFIATTVICAQLTAIAHAQNLMLTESVSLAINSAFQPDARLIGELRIPNSDRQRLPAVVIVNSSPGFDGRGAFYAGALNQGGIATFEVDIPGTRTAGDAARQPSSCLSSLGIPRAPATH